MEKISIVFLTILILKNLFLTIGLTIYLYRTCQKCQQVKQIDRMFTKLCSKCENGKEKKPMAKKKSLSFNYARIKKIFKSSKKQGLFPSYSSKLCHSSQTVWQIQTYSFLSPKT